MWIRWWEGRSYRALHVVLVAVGLKCTVPWCLALVTDLYTCMARWRRVLVMRVSPPGQWENIRFLAVLVVVVTLRMAMLLELCLVTSVTVVRSRAPRVGLLLLRIGMEARHRLMLLGGLGVGLTPVQEWAWALNVVRTLGLRV